MTSTVPTKVTIDIEMTPQEALDLAQFCKRVGFSDFRSNAQSENEAYRMVYAHALVYEALRRHGFHPR